MADDRPSSFAKNQSVTILRVVGKFDEAVPAEALLTRLVQEWADETGRDWQDAPFVALDVDGNKQIIGKDPGGEVGGLVIFEPGPRIPQRLRS